MTYSEAEADLPLIGLAPKSDEMSAFVTVHMKPMAGAAYGYSLILPRTWSKLSDPTGPDAVPTAARFTSLGIFSPFDPPLPPITMSVGVRLAVRAASVADAFLEYCRNEEFEVHLMRPQLYSAGTVIEGLVTQSVAPVGLMKVRMAMFEDNGRLFLLAGMAPGALYSDCVRALSLAMIAFELDFPQRSM